MAPARHPSPWVAMALFFSLVVAGGCGDDGAPTPPAITTDQTDQTVTEGQTATFTVAATGSGTLTYQWRRSDDGGSTWTDISGTTSAIYAFTATLDDDGALFRCVVSNAVGSVTSDEATLTVQQP